MVDQMPEVHEENSVAVENGDGDVPVEEQNLAHADESKGFGASQQECPVDQDSGSTEMQHVDSKEDMFVDAPEELNVDGREAAVAANGAEIEEVSQVKFDARESQFPGMENGTTDDNLDGELERMRAMLEKTVSEKVSIEREYKEEREAFARELADLHHQIKAFADEKHLLTGANQEKTMSVDVDVSLHQIMSECSKFLESVKQEQLQVETTIGELQGALYHKDEEIEDLNSKVAELLVSGDVASFYLNSVVEAESEALFEKNQHLEVVADRMLASLAIAVPQEEFMDNSLLGKITHIERCTSVLTESYNRIAYEIDQLRQCLFNAGSDLSVEQDFRSVLVDARDAVLELRKKEVELCDKLNHLEDENRELIQQADKDKETIGLVNGELGKTKMELEQEKTRCTNTKEKLSMAVTKGKALVQQRDALKQSLAEKVNELERCQVELQEKSSILETAELSKRELEKSLAEKANELEKCLIELQEKSSILDTAELSKKELELSLAEKENELEKYLIQLQEKSGALEAAELTKGELEESLAGKTNEIEKYLIELQEKSTALEASELSKEKLVKSDNLIASLQETLSQRNLTLENLEEFLSQIDIPEELQSMDVVERVRWLVDERNELRSVSMDYNKLKDAFSLINLPENVSFTDLESCLSWLRESYHQAEDERNMLQFQIERLSTSLSTELQEKDYIQKELDDLACRYGEMSEKAHKLSSEKDQMVRVLLESSGMTMEEQEGVYKTLSDPTVVIDRCFMKIREEATVPVETSHPNAEFFERLQSLLYMRDLDLMLCEEILGEEKLVRSQVIDLSNELRAASQVLAALKEEKDSLQKDLERSEDRSALLREKLSMAVKKGKGLVQDRENLKNLLGERDLEIGKLKLELQQQESKVVECMDEINMLSVDLERIPKLEADLVTMKDQRDQLELFLSQSNDMLQRVIESIDGIVLPVESVPQEPLEKVNWLTGYINECHHAKMQVEQDLKKVKEEASTLASKLAETQASAKVLEDALSVAENNISQLSDEKRQIEVGKNNVEIELQKAVEEACSLSSKFAEACATKKSLEDALLNAENNISSITKEKVEAQVGRAAAEMELEKVREEVVDQTNKLEEACDTIKSLEIALSKAESDVAMLTEQNNDAQLGRTNLENELEKLKDETASQASKLTDACTAIRSLEDAMLKAKNDFSALEDEKRSAEQELLTLNSKLSACMEELAGRSGSLKSRSAELTGYLIDLQLLLKDENLFSRVDQCFESKFKSLKDMDLIIRDIRGHYVDKVSAKLQGEYVMEENFVKSKLLFNGVNDTVNTLMENDEGNGADGNDICLCFGKIMEGFKMRNKILVDKFEDFSTCIDEQFAVLLGKLEVTRDDVVDMSDSIESLKQKVTNMEITREEQEKAIAMLENDVTLLLSACSEATRELQFDVKNNLLDLFSIPEIDKLNHNLFSEVQNVGGDDTVEHQQNLDGSKYITAAEELSSATRKVQTVTKLFERTSTLAATTIQDLKKKLEETMAAFEKVVEERDLSRNRVSALQTDVEELQVSCRELRHKVEDFEAKEDKWHEKEVELSSLCNGLLVKQQEAEDPLLSASQVRALLDKINGINIPSTESLEDLDSHSPSNVRRLFDIIDSIAEMQHQINLLSHEKEELQLNLSSQILQIERLKEEVETHNRNKPEEEKINAELSDLSFGLEKIIDLLGGSEFVVDQTSVGLKGLLPVLEKQVVAQLLETENLKTKAQELGTKLLGSQRVVDELSTKVKVLEDSLQVRTLKGETVQDRGIYEPPSLPSGSEISEIEDMGSVGNNAIAPVLPAPQMRTMRKGSTDHLAINIDSESDHLINKETDEDKGHVFKSLNTSGLIPKQGKMIADRIDGIWVSGGRVLMSRPQARLGLIAYTLFLHLWLLGTIL